MKQLILISYCIGFYVSPAASQQFYNTWFYNYSWVWEAGAGAGILNCLTDLGGKKGNGGRFMKDIDWRSSRPGFSFYISSTYKDIIAIRLDVQTGLISAGDSVLKQSAADLSGRYGRNLHFRSRIKELQLQVETHPLFWRLCDEDKIPAWSPYLVAGVSVFSFNPQAKLGEQWYNLQPLRLEGQGFAEYRDRKLYKTTQIAIPLGLGLRYETGPLFNIRFEFIYRILFTDYLDDVSTGYIDPSYFPVYLERSAVAVARRLYSRMHELQPGYVVAEGNQRGNPGSNDAYFGVKLKLGYVFRSKVK